MLSEQQHIAQPVSFATLSRVTFERQIMLYKSYFNWSGGKDSALALNYARKSKTHAIDRLVTTVNSRYRRISMHGVREDLLEAQAEAIGLPLQKVLLPDQSSMEDYDEIMGQTMEGLVAEGFTHSFFGDIFLEDLRAYREAQLAKAGFTAVFPLWKGDTRKLLNEFIDLGFKTIVICVNASLINKSFAGRVIDRDFLRDLPANVDPCGEHGEFHTFVFDGPIFKKPVPFSIGEKVFR